MTTNDLPPRCENCPLRTNPLANEIVGKHVLGHCNGKAPAEMNGKFARIQSDNNGSTDVSIIDVKSQYPMPGVDCVNRGISDVLVHDFPILKAAGAKLQLSRRPR